jgi:hypothetical protein
MYEPVSPSTLKRVVEKVGYKLFYSDALNWVMECNGHILMIPQTMALLPSDVLENLLRDTAVGLNDETFNLLASELKSATPTGRPAHLSPN